MRSYLWCLMLPAFLNCSGENVVAGKEKTRSEQLEASLPKWCQQACARLAQCEEDCACEGDVCNCVGGADEDCPDECQKEIGRWAAGGDECAAVGERIKKCVDDAGCEASQNKECSTTPEERDACPKDGDTSEPPSSNGADGGAYDYPIDNTGGTISYAGSASFGGSTSTAGTASTTGGVPGLGGAAGGTATGEPVTCQGGSALGRAGSANSPLVCEESRRGCSDDHEYDWYCVQTSDNQRVCSCLLDGTLTTSFEWSDSCPAVQEINVACGWRLSPDNFL